MILRAIAPKVLELSQKMPVVSLSGPRQSGKTTLARHLFSDYEYLSFEDPDTRERFDHDPRAFLGAHDGRVIFDEDQRAPELFSYLQAAVDDRPDYGRFVLTGSQDFLMMRGITQSLAGRVALFKLLPLSFRELNGAGEAPQDRDQWLLQGGYPALYDRNIDPADYYGLYVNTYLERDVRAELGVRKLAQFSVFLQLCALRTGQQLNKTDLATDAGVSVGTVGEWLSLLEASGILFQLQPWTRSRGKRLTKRPKLYFCDAGLAAHLAGVDSLEGLEASGLCGHLFETAVISDLRKAEYARGRRPEMSFWRDAKGNEIDLVVEKGLRAIAAIEIKSGTTFRQKYFQPLERQAVGQLGLSPAGCAVVNGGAETSLSDQGSWVSYRDLEMLEL